MSDGYTYDVSMFRETFETQYTYLNGFLRNVARFGDAPALHDPQSVSYTHLDVYKRQVISIIAVFCSMLVMSWQLTIAVSYTHLDVYKRQGKECNAPREVKEQLDGVNMGRGLLVRL